jgi:quercetin dioxygenase-like cupin family protein
MRRRSLSAGLAVLFALCLLAAVAVAPSLAQNPIEAQPLSARSVFPDDIDLKAKIKLDGHATVVVNMDDPSWTQVVMFTVQPGAMFPWHSHPGMVVVNVTSGELVYVAAMDCVERPYSAGQAFVDPGHGHVHTAFNRGSVPTVIVATFYGLTATGPFSEPVAPPADCAVTP